MTPHISIIVAVTDDLAIGRDGDQPYYISGDLRRFKALTMGHPIIMGRRTFEALPRGPLPGRTNIVITRDTTYAPEGVVVVHGIDEAVEAAQRCDGADEIFVIGGGNVYRTMLSLCNKLYLTCIHATVPDADTHFPAIAPHDWTEIATDGPHTDDREAVTYHHRTLIRHC